MSTEFSRVINALRPLMKGEKSLGRFAITLVDMGVEQSGIVASDLKALSTWKGYANGRDRFSKRLASTIASHWGSFTFEANFMDAYGEQVLNELADSLSALDPNINKGNVGKGLGDLLFNVFKKAAGHEDVSLPPGLLHAENVKRGSQPYFDRKSGKLYLGDDVIRHRKPQEVPDVPQEHELSYLRPLLAAYCEGCKLSADPRVEDIPNRRYQNHFHEQRKAYYSAEWLRETSWDCIEDGQAVFDEFVEEVYQGVMDTNFMPYATGVERLFETLKQSTSISLQSVQLAQIIDLIDNPSRKGVCHQLASEDRLFWVDE